VSAPAASRWALLTDPTAVRHFLEMLVAMAVGMVALGPLWPDLATDRVEAHTLVMATNMTVGMTALMLWRRHRPAAVVEMALAMYVPFVLLFPAHGAGWLSAGAVVVVGHVLMLPAMVLAMLHRPEEYTAHRPRLTRT
jgi:flagellar biosynthetic protein FliP